jgi:hypothetical protein
LRGSTCRSGFRNLHLWRLHVTIASWTIFALMLLVLEPLRARHRAQDPGSSLAGPDVVQLQRVHLGLLAAASITALAAVAGSHGFLS